MSTTAFICEMVRLQRATTESHDNVVRQSKVLAALNLRTGERVLEFACGGGQYSVRTGPGPTPAVAAPRPAGQTVTWVVSKRVKQKP